MSTFADPRAGRPAPLDYGEISRAYLTARMWAAAALAAGAGVFAGLSGWGEMLVVVGGGAASSLHSALIRDRRTRSPEPILYLDAAIIALGGLAVRLVPAAYAAPAIMLSTVAFLTLDRRRLLRFLAFLTAVTLPASLASVAPPAGIPPGAVVTVAGLATAIFTFETFGVLAAARRALAVRRTYEEALSSVVEAAAGGIILVGADGVVRLSNAAADAMFAGPEGLAGRPISSVRGRVFDPDGTPVAPGEETSTRTLATGEKTGPTERIVETPAGRRLVVAVTGVPLTGPRGEVSGVVLSFADVTELRSLAAELAGRNAELVEAQRARMELIASVSHELRTPLTAVVGLAGELAEGGFDGAEARELARIVFDESREVAAIVDDLLVAARAEAGELVVRSVDVDLVSEAAQAIAQLPGGAMSLRPSGPVRGRVDPVRFRQIVRNLYTNALRYGGPTVRVHVEPDGDRAVLRVVDDGPGIPPDRRDRIFEPFERSRDAGAPGSVGLGLTVSRRLARLQGGDLTYRYAAGESIFELVVPAAGDPGPVSGEAPPGR